MPTLEQVLDRIGGLRRAVILLTGVLLVALILGVSHWATRPTWVPVFTGLPLETIGEVTQRLEEAGIEYRLEQGGGSVMVSSDDLARARVTLAQQGLPDAGRPGLELFDQPSWGMTDFAQRINYRRALEGELERTIGKMRGVEGAQVHLAIHETSSFRTTNKPSEASVVLKLRGGVSASADMVQGIAHLVASSIDGLESGNVAVLDDGGRLLSAPAEAGSLTALTSQQLGMQREIEQYLEGKAEQLLTQFMGAGNARVQVAADLNFDRVERTTESMDPDGQVMAAEQRSEIVPGAEGGAASTTSTTEYQNSRVLETFSGAPGDLTRLSVAVLVNDRMMPPPDGEGDPVVVPRTPEELARIETLVRSAVGLNNQRGDLISVVSVPFDGVATVAMAAEADGTPVMEVVRSAQRPALTLLGLVLAFIVAMRVLKMLRDATPRMSTMPALTHGDPMLDNLPRVEAPPEPIVVKRTSPIINTVMRDRVVASVEEHPNLAARLVRAWMREA
ncbi:MAG TPA: flagellar basal-body MS-ring/collar protein FliF [Longimicrobiaceae bacterium]